MVSALWKACSDGDLDNVFELLKDASTVDIEIKDHTGVTPLIEAVKNGHVEVVRVLLDKGADPTSASSQARPEQYTSDPAILELLHFAQSKMSPNGIPVQESGYQPEDPSKRYYPPPPGPYAYYPSIAHGPPMPDGAVAYYPPPPPPSGDQQHQGGPGNLPPPEIARFIPCRYFPACRYGSSCLFAHPQGPYFQGPLPPPAQYPTHYDSMAPPAYPPNYYAVPPPSFQPPNGVLPHMTPMSPSSGPHQTPPPHTPLVHTQSGSEVVSPVQSHFTPPTGPPPVPYGAMSPPNYPHPGQAPVPLSIPPLPPLHHQSAQPGPQSPTAMYHNSQHNVPPPPPFAVRPDAAVNHYPPAPQGTYAEVNGGPNAGPKSPPLRPQQDGYGPAPGYREGMSHHRRGSARRGSFSGTGRKPACLFFPSGRCRNGDECRFPHVMPEGPGPHHPSHFSGRGGARQRGGSTANGFGAIEEKLTNMTIRDDLSSRQNGAEGSSRSQSTEAGSRSRYSQNFKPNHVTNGARVDKRASLKQRVPNADEFPVLAGSTTPPLRSPGLNGSLSNGHAGPTAAQVLQAPPPVRRDSTKESTTRDGSPELVQPAKDSKHTSEPNGIVPEVPYEAVTKLPASFAAITTGAPDAGKEVSVSA